ncbi:MAG: hypothetical protein RLZZ106_8 [Cyanobacteriota bacterium]|jgi:hypothetical protein
MNVRDANWKQILSCDALDLSVVYATASLLGCALSGGAEGYPEGVYGVESMTQSLQLVQFAGEKGIICANGAVVAPVLSNSCA